MLAADGLRPRSAEHAARPLAVAVMLDDAASGGGAPVEPVSSPPPASSHGWRNLCRAGKAGGAFADAAAAPGFGCWRRFPRRPQRKA